MTREKRGGNEKRERGKKGEGEEWSLTRRRKRKEKRRRENGKRGWSVK